MTLKKVLGRTFISLTGLQTVITEIEAVLNDWSITYISADVSDPEPLTPAHLQYGCRLVPLPYQSREETDDPDFGENTGAVLRTGYPITTALPTSLEMGIFDIPSRAA